MYLDRRCREIENGEYVEAKEKRSIMTFLCLRELFPENGYRTGEVELPCGFAPSNRYPGGILVSIPL